MRPLYSLFIIVLLKCSEFMEQLDIVGHVIFNTIKVAELNMLIRHQFNSDRYKKKNIKKSELREIYARFH